MTAAADPTPLDIGDLTVDQLPDVARRGRPIAVSPEALARVAAGRLHIEDLAGRPGADLRGLHRVRGTGHGGDRPGAARRPAGQPDPLARGRHRRPRRARHGAGDDGAAAAHPEHRPHGCATRGGHRAGRPAQRRDHPRRPRVRVAGLQRRPLPAGARGDRPAGRGTGRQPRRNDPPRSAGAGRGRAHPGRPGREGGPGPHQRHRRDARDARPGPGRPRRPGPDRRHHDRHERGGPAGHGPRVRRRPGGHAPAPGAGRLRGEPAPAARGIARSSPVTATTRPTWSRTRTRCDAHPRWPARRATPWPTRAASPSGSWTRSSTTRSSPWMAASSPTATSTAPRWPTSWTSWRSPWPMWPRSASGAPTGCWTARATRASRPSWPTRSGSTPAT